MNKRAELLAKREDELTPNEKYYLVELETNPNITFEESTKKREEYMNKLEAQIREGAAKLLYYNSFRYKALQYLLFFLFLICFTLWANLCISFAFTFFHHNTIKIYPLLVLFYYGILCGGGFIVLLGEWKPDINKQKLISSLFLFYVAFFIVTLFVDINRNISTYIGSYYLFDDTEYVENPDYEVGPYSGSAGEYYSNYKYFISEEFLNSGNYSDEFTKIEVSRDKISAYFRDPEGLIPANLKKATFWQYAAVLGYKPMKGEYPLAGFFRKAFIVLPGYFLEEILQQLINAVLFGTTMILLIAFKKIDLEGK